MEVPACQKCQLGCRDESLGGWDMWVKDLSMCESCEHDVCVMRPCRDSTTLHFPLLIFPHKFNNTMGELV